MTMKTTTIVALLAGFVAVAASADDLVSTHGFGTWAYGRTDTGRYLAGDEDGDYSFATMSLNFSAMPWERTFVAMQPEWTMGPDGDDTELDFVFAEYQLHDMLRLRAGLVNQPFGVYSEVFSVGTLRPFLFLPQSVYGPSSSYMESYRGVGATGRIPLGDEMALAYDVYGGMLEMGGEANVGVIIPVLAGMAPESNLVELEVSDAIGGRLVLETPLEGLSIGASGYTGEGEGVGEANGFRMNVYGAQLTYIRDRVAVRGEFVSTELEDTYEAEMAYIEASVRVYGGWEVAARFDHLDASLPGVDMAMLPGAIDQLISHQELAVGVNYWFTPELVAKVSYHWITGNMYAGPEDLATLGQQTMSDTLDDETEMVMAGVSFSF